MSLPLKLPPPKNPPPLPQIKNTTYIEHILKAGLDPGPWTLDSGLWTLDSGFFSSQNFIPPPEKNLYISPPEKPLYPPGKNLYISPMKLPLPP